MDQGRDSIFPRQDMPGFCQMSPPKDRGRRECRALSRTREPCVQKNVHSAHASNTGQPRSSGIPCTMVLRLIARSPRGTGLDSPRRPPIIAGRLDPSIGGPGPRAFAVRVAITRQLMTLRPSHPAPTLVTIANAPPCRARDAQSKTTDLPDGTSRAACDTITRRAICARTPSRY